MAGVDIVELNKQRWFLAFAVSQPSRELGAAASLPSAVWTLSVAFLFWGWLCCETHAPQDGCVGVAAIKAITVMGLSYLCPLSCEAQSWAFEAFSPTYLNHFAFFSFFLKLSCW